MYGKEVDMYDLELFLGDFLEVNRKLEEMGRGREVLAIWGPPGIGKTERIRQFRKEGYEVIECPMAQFEEMGDISGMPIIVDGVTKMAPPDWVPKKEGKGILLFDDFNRASSRILKGTMQLLQYYETIYWKIPKGYSIILTANPDNAEYIVTTIDAAMLTRMKHIILRSDHKAWAEWAERRGINGSCINFILMYHEMLSNGERTNPRSLTNWFDYITFAGINDDNMNMIEMHGMASVDTEVVAAFINFIRTETDMFIEPEDILNNYDKEKSKIAEYIKDQRVDILGIILERVKNVIINPEYDSKGKKDIHARGLQNLLVDCESLRDLVYMNLQQIVSKAPKRIEMITGNRKLASIIRDVAV